MNAMLATMTTSVTELKRNYAGILKQADDCPVAVLNHNRPEAYLLPAAYYESLVAYMEDLEDAKLVRERSEGPFIAVNLDEL
jgi:antitoxin StbD